MFRNPITAVLTLLFALSALVVAPLAESDGAEQASNAAVQGADASKAPAAPVVTSNSSKVSYGQPVAYVAQAEQVGDGNYYQDSCVVGFHDESVMWLVCAKSDGQVVRAVTVDHEFSVINTRHGDREASHRTVTGQTQWNWSDDLSARPAVHEFGHDDTNTYHLDDCRVVKNGVEKCSFDLGPGTMTLWTKTLDGQTYAQLDYTSDPSNSDPDFVFSNGIAVNVFADGTSDGQAYGWNVR